MKRAAGLWIDHRKAILVMITADGEHVKHIESHVIQHVRFVNGSRAQTPDGLKRVAAADRRDQPFADHLDRYYDEVIARIGAVESIQLFGPGEAKGEIKERLATTDLGIQVVSSETVDKMTDRQVEAKVRQRLLQRRRPGNDNRHAAMRGMPANAGAATLKSQGKITHRPE